MLSLAISLSISHLSFKSLIYLQNQGLVDFGKEASFDIHGHFKNKGKKITFKLHSVNKKNSSFLLVQFCHPLSQVKSFTFYKVLKILELQIRDWACVFVL